MKDQGIYEGNFGCREDVEKQYQVELDKDVRILYAGYWYKDYFGDSVVLFNYGRRLYEVRGGHCSCYGLERQWDPDEVTKEQMLHMFKEGTRYNHCKDSIMQAMGWKG